MKALREVEPSILDARRPRLMDRSARCCSVATFHLRYEFELVNRSLHLIKGNTKARRQLNLLGCQPLHILILRPAHVFIGVRTFEEEGFLGAVEANARRTRRS